MSDEDAGAVLFQDNAKVTPFTNEAEQAKVVLASDATLEAVTKDAQAAILVIPETSETA